MYKYENPLGLSTGDDIEFTSLKNKGKIATPHVLRGRIFSTASLDQGYIDLELSDESIELLLNGAHQHVTKLVGIEIKEIIINTINGKPIRKPVSVSDTLKELDDLEKRIKKNGKNDRSAVDYKSIIKRFGKWLNLVKG